MWTGALFKVVSVPVQFCGPLPVTLCFRSAARQIQGVGRTLMVGFIVGLPEGAADGKGEGATLGTSLGTSLGVNEGAMLGTLLGISLGTVLGIEDGDSLGMTLGASDGAIDGTEESLPPENRERPSILLATQPKQASLPLYRCDMVVGPWAPSAPRRSRRRVAPTMPIAVRRPEVKIMGHFPCGR